LERNEDEAELCTVVKYIEPVFLFCVKRLNNRQDAEDLASEIMVHILNGVKKYHIDSLEKWVWRIAHNRYARFINMRNKHDEVQSEYDFTGIRDDYDFVDEMIIVDEYRQVFKQLHTLSCEYRNILVDYYIEGLPVKQIAENYSLTETTVKWRLNIGRKKIKARIGENKMDKVYKPLNWNTDTGNGGFFSPDKYLQSQVARAICAAAYEKPLTVEEISLKTGLPAMYIEDELPRLIYGEAIKEDGNKYAANFIVLRLCDKRAMEVNFAPFIASIADHFAELFNEHKDDVSKMDFYGSDLGTKKLGYIGLPAVLREKIVRIKEGLNIIDGPFPPRLDGGFGWIIVDEKEIDNSSPYTADFGIAITGTKTGRETDLDLIYYFLNSKYPFYDVYHTGGVEWIYEKKIIDKSKNGYIPDNALTDDDKVRLLEKNLIVKDGDKYRINFPIFERTQYDEFKEFFIKADAKLDDMLAELITVIHKGFKAFVPKRLDSQINQWVTIYVSKIIAFVEEELINRGVLEKPDNEKLFTNGIFCVKGGNVII